jgi:hypothetical protein
MKLREKYDSLEELCYELDVNEDDLIKELNQAGFEYYPELNQFR